MADGDEGALAWKGRFFSGFYVFEFGCGEGFVADEFNNVRIPDEGDLGIIFSAILHDFTGLEFVSSMDDGNFVGEFGEEGGFFHSGVAAADDDDVFSLEESAVAGGAGGNAAASEFGFAPNAEPASVRTGGDDDGFGFVGFVFHRYLFYFFGELYTIGVFGDELGAESFGLVSHFFYEFRAVDTFGEARVVFHFGGEGQLSARGDAFDHEGLEVGAGAIDGCGEAGAASADDDDIELVVWHFDGGDG